MSSLSKLYREFKQWCATAPRNYVLFWNWNQWEWSEPFHYYLTADILPIIGEYSIDGNGTLHCTSVMGGHDTFPFGTYIVCSDRRTATQYRKDIYSIRDNLIYPQMPQKFVAMSKAQEGMPKIVQLQLLFSHRQ